MVMGSLIQQFPVSHKTFSLAIKGNKTDVVICGYDDHIFVIATQIGTMGTILQARSTSFKFFLPLFNIQLLGKIDGCKIV
uniref:Uncharacterized protein LOC105641481 isoform X2 n=1 Tax=Rhizophora mucronata TaxID=61149 RepID=A0A2P2JLA9_RHIMU